MSILMKKYLQEENLFIKIWRNIKTISILLILSPFIILAGLIYGEDCDNLYNEY